MAASSMGQPLASPHRGCACSSQLPAPGHLHPVHIHLQIFRAIFCKIKDGTPAVGAEEEEERRSPEKEQRSALPVEQVEKFAWRRAPARAEKKGGRKTRNAGC